MTLIDHFTARTNTRRPQRDAHPTTMESVRILNGEVNLEVTEHTEPERSPVDESSPLNGESVTAVERISIRILE